MAEKSEVNTQPQTQPVAPASSQPPSQSPSLEPINILQQQTSVKSKNTEADLKDTVSSLANSVNKFNENLEKLLNSGKPAAAPTGNILPPVITEAPKKSDPTGLTQLFFEN